MKQRGFSLLEVLLVLVIFALAAGFVGAYMFRGVSSAELRNASRGVVAALRETRAMALVSHEQQVLTIDTENKTYQAPGKDPVELPEEIEISMTTARQELVSNEVAGIRFFPDGASTGGRITLIVNNREYEITIAWLTGEARMSRVES